MYRIWRGKFRKNRERIPIATFYVQAKFLRVVGRYRGWKSSAINFKRCEYLTSLKINAPEVLFK